MARLDGHDVAGLGEGDGRGGWSTYVAVDDADDAVGARSRAAGGTVVEEPQDAGEGGRAATCTDPQGAVFRLWQARRRLGAQLTNAPGHLELQRPAHHRPRGAPRASTARCSAGRPPTSATPRCCAVPGYGDHLAATVDPGIHERQAAISAPPGFADAIAWLVGVDAGAPTGWQVTVTVDDRDASAARAIELGGEVLGTDDTDWTRTALVRDPQGAVLTLSEFTPPGG